MKNSLLAFLLMPCILFGQLIKTNETDNFTHEKRIVTKEINIVPEFSFKAAIAYVSLSSIDNKIFITISGNSKSAGIVLATDIALLITEKDTIAVQSAGMQNAYGKYQANTFDNIYSIKKEDLIKLSQQKLIAVKRYSSLSILETDVKEKYQTNLMEISAALLKEMN